MRRAAIAAALVCGVVALGQVEILDSSRSSSVSIIAGSSAISAGSETKQIVHSSAATTSAVVVQPTDGDATCTSGIWLVSKAAGSFTVTAPATCTADTNFDYHLANN